MAGNQTLKGWEMGKLVLKRVEQKYSWQVFVTFFWDGEVKRPFQKAVCDLPGSPGCFHLENVQPFNLQPAAKRGWEKKTNSIHFNTGIWRITLPETNIDTQNYGLENVSPFNYGYFGYLC